MHTSQYSDAGQRRERRAKVAKRTVRALAPMLMAGLPWYGAAIGHADTNREREACALMDDHATAIRLGYSSTPVQYALAVLSTEMPPEDAGHVLLAATQDACPNHAADLPPGWR
ncbi:hypothetical protein [Mycobacterium saskatchewanense]|uniref:hypothetical protein n=1 Tax=Mycobacterium saskatchewanense TaxID=220927 RepID=UPI00114EC010|nr:hypothetical protein [Mycobacterium saskatchewanense]